MGGSFSNQQNFKTLRLVDRQFSAPSLKFSEKGKASLSIKIGEI